MRLSLIKNGKIYNTDLPLKISGNFWIEDKDSNNYKRNLINIEEKNGKWILKSNFDVKIVSNGVIVEEITIEEYTLYELKVKGEKYNYLLYAMPVYDNSYKEYEIGITSQISIGNGPDNGINYANKYLSPQQCLLTTTNGKWHVKNLNNKNILYVNGIVTNDKYLKVGDVIFILGLKIIICGSYLIINEPKDFVGIEPSVLSLKSNINENEDFIVEEEDTEMKVYNKNEYFFRMPRFRLSVEEEEILIDPPPESEKMDEMPLAYTLGPMITMGITSMVSGIVAVGNVASGTQSLSSALPSIITCLALLCSMILWPFLQKKYNAKQKARREKIRIDKYNAYIDERRTFIRNEVAKKKQSLIETYVPLKECQQIIVNRKRNLWERKIEHDDFLTVRLGVGNVDSYLKVNYPEEHFSLTENNLRDVLNKLGNESKIMTDVPVTTNLTEKYISAIVGKDVLTYSFIQGLLLQIMAFHSYEDLKIVIMTSNDMANRWDFLKVSPYCWDDDKSIRFFATDVDEANQISIYLENQFSNRKYENGDTQKIKKTDFKQSRPYFLIITDDYQSLRNIEIIKSVLNQKTNLGFSMLLVQERLLGLPNECSTFISIDTNESGIFENELTKDKQQVFKADFLNDINMEQITKCIANIPIELEKDRYALPNKIGFLEMYNVGKIEQLNPLNRWKKNNPITSLSVPVGIDTNGELFKLDIHEKFHGPHGLVAGMTGSGKSEFIITYILSMAINYSPEEVSFVLIDYKGGGLAGAFYNKETGIKLPHLAGTITNLDVNDMKRSLESIESELKRRQKIFNDARQTLNESTIDIYKYQKLYREGKVSEPVPHLCIISDEFAELKAQQPEFMEQLISTARIGRSLGVHLILATQKPSGVVDEQIWSNTKFRICLKVQDKSDSIEMIKCADAASLHNVGRFYLQVGYNEFFALGQSAYAGVPYQNTDKLKRKVDTNICFVNNVGYVVKSIDKEEQVLNHNEGEELSNIVNYLYDIAKDEGICANQLWLDKIPETIYVDDLQKKYNYVREKCIINPVIGEYDVPTTQQQHLLTLPLTKEGNTIIYGAAGMGKENLISTIIFSTLINHTPEEVNLYILDFGAETLKLYEGAPHVGDVLLSNDKEKINNLIKMLKEEINKRKKIFSEYGGTYESYIKNSNDIVPTIIVVINLFEAFEEMYFELQEDFASLTREGFKYGIIFIISTNGVNFIRYKLKQHFKQNIVLQLNNEMDYSDIVGNTHGLYPSKIKGRGLIKYDKVYEFQSAKIKTKGNDSEYIRKLCDTLKLKYDISAKRVPVLPNLVNYDIVKESTKGLDSIPVGIEKNSLEVCTFDLRTKPITIISSNDTTALEEFIPEFMKVCSSDKKMSINLLDAEKLFENNKFSCNYYKENFDQIFNKLFDYLKKINQAYVASNYNVKSLEKCQDLLIVIVGLNQLNNKLSSDSRKKFGQFMNMTKDIRKVSIVIVDVIDNIRQFEYEDWYKTSVSNNHGIWIGDGIADQYTIKLSKNPKYIKEDIGNKFGYSIKKGNPTLIKVLSNSTDEEVDEDV